MSFPDKIKMIEQNMKGHTELQKTREIKALLMNADEKTKEKLMRDFGEMERLLTYLDADQQRNNIT